MELEEKKKDKPLQGKWQEEKRKKKKKKKKSPPASGLIAGLVSAFPRFFFLHPRDFFHLGGLCFFRPRFSRVLVIADVLFVSYFFLGSASLSDGSIMRA